MGLIIYNIGIWFYRTFIYLAAPFNKKASLFAEGRKRWAYRLKNEINGQNIWWFHCASLGEFEQGRPVMEKLKKENPGIRVLVTFFSPSGYEIQKNFSGADHICYLPMDTYSNAREFLNIVKPVVAVFVKYEFWYHYFTALSERNIPLVLISSIFRQNQPFFKIYGGLHRKMLQHITMIFTQDRQSLKLLESIDIINAKQAGDTRFDRVWQIKNKAEEIEGIKAFKGNRQVLVVGSCWKEDLEVLIPYINNGPEGLKYIIAPHEITESNLKMLEREIQPPTVRHSLTSGIIPENTRVLLIDSIGLLSRLYRYGEYAFVGGAFGDGLHNILEPAVFGLPVFFGNRNFEKFREATELIEIGGAWAVKDYFEFEQKFSPLLDETFRMKISEIVTGFTESKIGATDQIVEYLNNIRN